MNLQEKDNSLKTPITMYGWKNAKTGRISMIYDSLKLLQMCSPDHFESRTINKEGNVVELEVYIKCIIK